jgi:signal transduction histidine kinase/CheY-like chemotaxis protein
MTNILIVDDDEDFADSAVKFLEQRTTWKAQYALDADAAEKKLKTGGFDALTLDRNLSDKGGRPGRWGDELFRDLRSDPAFDQLAVVFLTAFGTPQNSAEMVQLGAFQYLTKPVPLDNLVPTLAAAMAWQRSLALRRALPASDIPPDAVLNKILKILAAVRPPGDYPLQLIPAGASKDEEGAGIFRVLSDSKPRRSLLLSRSKEGVRQWMPTHPDAESLLAARVLGPDGKIAVVLAMESRDPKAFDMVWLSVIESFADAMCLSYKLQSLKRQVVEQSWKSLTEAAAEFRHTFNGVLQVMKTHAQRIASVDLSALDNEGRERLLDSSTTINASVDRLAAYVKRMTSFGDELKPNPAPVDLDMLIAGCWAALKNRAVDLNVRFFAGPALGVIDADPMMLEESLFCLLSNALDSIEDRQNVKGVSQADAIHVTVDNVGGAETRISVRDTGIGFDPAAKEKLFLPFYTTKTDRPLTATFSPHEGIGLFTVRRVMLLHGGDVIPDSPGYYQGATFMLSLPKRE